MAKAYFLNAQTENITFQVNGALDSHPLAQLNAQPPENFVGSVGLQPIPDKDVVGTNGSANTVDVTSAQAGRKQWQVTMDSSITSSEDVQFLVFDNRLLARQDSNVTGITITGPH